MVMSYIFVGFVTLSLFSAILTGQGDALSRAVLEGAGQGVSLAVSIAGSLCLWSGLGTLMEKAGVTALLSRLLLPALGRIFPSAREDQVLSGALCGNVCANFLGLGNAATPLGVRAARRLAREDRATDELCRLIVLNTASIQLLPTTVAAVRASLGSREPFSILPAVWISSILSAGLGLLCAWLLGRMWQD